MKRNWGVLRELERATKSKRKKLLAVGKDDLLLAICEIVDNVLKGTVKLNNVQKKKLLRYKKELRNIADRKASKTSKKKVLNQRGGFLPLILTPALGLIASLVGEVIGNAISK
jgi:hypothetical protein